MATFEVTIQQRIIEYLRVEVEADTTAEAEATVQVVIEACDHEAIAIAEHYGITDLWELEAEVITVVQAVEQLSPA